MLPKKTSQESEKGELLPPQTLHHLPTHPAALLDGRDQSPLWLSTPSGRLPCTHVVSWREAARGGREGGSRCGWGSRPTLGCPPTLILELPRGHRTFCLMAKPGGWGPQFIHVSPANPQRKRIWKLSRIHKTASIHCKMKLHFYWLSGCNNRNFFLKQKPEETPSAPGEAGVGGAWRGSAPHQPGHRLPAQCESHSVTQQPRHYPLRAPHLPEPPPLTWTLTALKGPRRAHTR